MTPEKGPTQAYSWEELLSFDRLRRAVTNRVLKQLDEIMEKEFPVNPERIKELIPQEWQRAKEAVRLSPQAREAARKHLERLLTDEIDKLIQKDKPELEALGVAEKSL